MVLMIAGSMQVSVFTMTCQFTGRTVAEFSPITSCSTHSTDDDLVIKAQCCDFSKFLVKFDQNYLRGNAATPDVAVSMAMLPSFSKLFQLAFQVFQPDFWSTDLPPPGSPPLSPAKLQIFLV